MENYVANRIFVKNLPYKITNEEFEQIFLRFGPVKTCTVIVRDNGRGETIHRGIGFLTFETEEGYLNCINSKEPLEVYDRTIIISPALKEGEWQNEKNGMSVNAVANESAPISRNERNSASTRKNNYFYKKSIGKTDDKNQENDTLYVANIPPNITDVQLRQIFMKYKPYELRIIENDDMQSSFAFVRIIDEEPRIIALEKMDGYVINDRKISVRIAGAPFNYA